MYQASHVRCAMTVLVFLFVNTDVASYRIPLLVTQVIESHDGYFNAVCPRCAAPIGIEYVRYCTHCGQRLSWWLYDFAEELQIPYSPKLTRFDRRPVSRILASVIKVLKNTLLQLFSNCCVYMEALRNEMEYYKSE